MKTLELKNNFAVFSCCELLSLGTLKTFPGFLELDRGRSILSKNYAILLVTVLYL